MGLLAQLIKHQVNHLTPHDDVIKWKHFPCYWSFVRGIHRSPVNSPHKGQWCGVLMFSLICAWINSWVNNHEAGDLRSPLHSLWRHCNEFHFFIHISFWFNIKMLSYQYWKSHCGHKTVIRLSYIYKENSYTGKTTSLYWISPQIFVGKL